MKDSTGNTARKGRSLGRPFLLQEAGSASEDVRCQKISMLMHLLETEEYSDYAATIWLEVDPRPTGVVPELRDFTNPHNFVAIRRRRIRFCCRR